jgi:hypothetical protein
MTGLATIINVFTIYIRAARKSTARPHYSSRNPGTGVNIEGLNVRRKQVGAWITAISCDMAWLQR